MYTQCKNIIHDDSQVQCICIYTIHVVHVVALPLKTGKYVHVCVLAKWLAIIDMYIYVTTVILEDGIRAYTKYSITYMYCM